MTRIDPVLIEWELFNYSFRPIVCECKLCRWTLRDVWPSDDSLRNDIETLDGVFNPYKETSNV